MVDKDTQIRQRWLKAKIIKTGHVRHYIKDACHAWERNKDKDRNSNLEERITTNKQTLRKKTKKKRKEELERMAGMYQ